MVSLQKEGCKGEEGYNGDGNGVPNARGRGRGKGGEWEGAKWKGGTQINEASYFTPPHPYLLAVESSSTPFTLIDRVLVLALSSSFLCNTELTYTLGCGKGRGIKDKG